MQNKIYQSLDKYKKEKDFINLIETNFPTIFQYPVENIQKSIFDYLIHRGYEPDSKGLKLTRTSIIDYYGSNFDDIIRTQLDIENVFITASSSESYSLIFNSLKDDNSEILLPNPSYPLFEHLAQFSNLKVNYYELDINREWDINLDSFQNNITTNTKFLVLIVPNNPTGSIPTLDTLRNVLEICEKNNIYLIIDEVFSIFDFEGKYKSFYKYLISTAKCKYFILNGISKMFALPDMKLAWMISQNLDVEELDKLELYNDTYLNANYLSQNILPDLFGKSSEFQTEMIELIRSNLDYLNKQLENVSFIKFVKNTGGIHVYLKIFTELIASEEEFVLELLEKKHIFIHPGYFYNNSEYKTRDIVISLLNTKNTFKEGLDTLIKFIYENIRQI